MVETEMFQNEIEVAAVGFEIDVEEVPDQWDAAGRRIEADVGQHLKKLVIRHAKPARLVDDVETDCSAGEVTDTRDQSNE